jgi:hypothetical protein
MVDLLTLVLLALAAYRITRLIVIDSIFDEVRDWIDRKVGDLVTDKVTGQYRRRVVIEKIQTLLGCTWCVGVWVSLGIYWLWAGEFDFIPVAAVAGLQGLLHAFEPGE